MVHLGIQTASFLRVWVLHSHWVNISHISHSWLVVISSTRITEIVDAPERSSYGGCQTNLVAHHTTLYWQYVMQRTNKISTFVPITSAIHLVASQNHRGCMHTYHCRARAARHYITLSSKGIGLTRICTLLTRLPQNVDCIIIIESYPQYYYLETRHQLVDFRVNGSAKRRIGRSAGSMSTSSSP